MTYASDVFREVTEKYGVDGNTRKLNPVTDPIDRKLFILSYSLMHAEGTLQSIVDGNFKSTDKDPVYAGGVVSPGNRIFTPAEGAANVLRTIDEFQKGKK